MIWEIIKKEILGIIKSSKFIYTFLICTILILMSVYVGADNYIAELEEYNTGINLNKKNLEEIDSYGALGSLGMKLTKPPEVLRTPLQHLIIVSFLIPVCLSASLIP